MNSHPKRQPTAAFQDAQDRARLEQATDALQACELETIDHAELKGRLSLD